LQPGEWGRDLPSGDRRGGRQGGPSGGAAPGGRANPARSDACHAQEKVPVLHESRSGPTVGGGDHGPSAREDGPLLDRVDGAPTRRGMSPLRCVLITPAQNEEAFIA